MTTEEQKDMFEANPAPLVREAITELYQDHISHPNHDTAFYFWERANRVIREANLPRSERIELRILIANYKLEIQAAHEKRAQQWSKEDA